MHGLGDGYLRSPPALSVPRLREYAIDKDFTPFDVEDFGSGFLDYVKNNVDAIAHDMGFAPEALFKSLCRSIGMEEGLIWAYYNHPHMYGDNHLTPFEPGVSAGDAELEGARIHPISSGNKIASGGVIEDDTEHREPMPEGINREPLKDRMTTIDPRNPSRMISRFTKGKKGEINKKLLELRSLGYLDKNFIGTPEGDAIYYKNKKGKRRDPPPPSGSSTRPYTKPPYDPEEDEGRIVYKGSETSTNRLSDVFRTKKKS